MEFWLFPLHPLSQQRKYQYFRVVIIVITSSVSFKSDLYLVFMCVCKKSAFVLPGHFQLQFDGSQLRDVHQHHLRPCHKEVCACTRYHANQQPAQTLCFRHLKQRMPLVKDTHRKFFLPTQTVKQTQSGKKLQPKEIQVTVIAKFLKGQKRWSIQISGIKICNRCLHCRTPADMSDYLYLKVVVNVWEEDHLLLIPWLTIIWFNPPSDLPSLAAQSY